MYGEKIMGIASAETCRAWRLRNKGRVKETSKRYRELNLASRAEYNRLWKRVHKERISAQRKAQYALNRGKIFKEPCSVCGETISVMHHDDYSKPLEITWLCVSHHQYLHSLAIKKCCEGE